MSIDRTLDRIDKLGETLARFENLIDKIPRLAELFGVAFFAGKATENVGGDFNIGALGGMVADGLAHSNFPHNQIAGTALGVYFSAIGLLNIIPFGVPALPPLFDLDPTADWIVPPDQQYTPEKGGIIITASAKSCELAGGKVVKSGLELGAVWCEFPPQAPPAHPPLQANQTITTVNNCIRQGGFPIEYLDDGTCICEINAGEPSPIRRGGR